MSSNETDRLHTQPDYHVGNFMLIVSEYCDFSKMLRLGQEGFGAISEVAHDAYRAINLRGARVGELVEAIRNVRAGKHGDPLPPVPDSHLASMALMVVERVDDAKKLGIDWEPFQRVRLLATAVHDAIEKRGATSHELVAALRGVRAHGSILEDLPSVQQKLREREE